MRLALILAMLAAPAAAEDRILVLGDSVMAWNEGRGQSVAHVIEDVLDRRVDSRAVPGARFSAPNLWAMLNGRDIRAQYDYAPADWVVIGGGANDMFEECDCSTCTGTLDRMISRDPGAGEIPAFLDQVFALGTRVIWVDYYNDPVGGSPFSHCAEELAELQTRLEALAAVRPAMAVLDAGTLIDRQDARLYDPDRIHPSPEGSRLIGARVARIIAASD